MASPPILPSTVHTRVRRTNSVPSSGSLWWKGHLSVQAFRSRSSEYPVSDSPVSHFQFPVFQTFSSVHLEQFASLESAVSSLACPVLQSVSHRRFPAEVNIKPRPYTGSPRQPQAALGADSSPPDLSLSDPLLTVLQSPQRHPVPIWMRTGSGFGWGKNATYYTPTCCVMGDIEKHPHCVTNLTLVYVQWHCNSDIGGRIDVFFLL